MTRTLFVSDLDGTLLNRQSVVSERSRETLNDLIVNHGTLFSIATARTPATAVKLMSGIATNIPLVVMAGAAMWDNTVKQYVYTMPIAESCVGKFAMPMSVMACILSSIAITTECSTPITTLSCLPTNKHL